MSLFSTIRHWFSEAPHFEGVIAQTERVGSRIQKVTIALPSPVTTVFPIGSYVQAMTWGCVPRDYSVAIADTQSFTILVSFGGGGTGARFFRDATVGTTITCYGPFADFPYNYGTGRSKVFFATSTGVAPFRRMVEEAIKEGVSTVLLLGSPKESDIAFKGELDELSNKYQKFTFVPVLSGEGPEWKGARGFLTDQVKGKEDFLRVSDIYICGIPVMTLGVLKVLSDIGVPENQIFVQKFG